MDESHVTFKKPSHFTLNGKRYELEQDEWRSLLDALLFVLWRLDSAKFSARVLPMQGNTLNWFEKDLSSDKDTTQWHFLDFCQRHVYCNLSAQGIVKRCNQFVQQMGVSPYQFQVEYYESGRRPTDSVTIRTIRHDFMPPNSRVQTPPSVNPGTAESNLITKISTLVQDIERLQLENEELFERVEKLEKVMQRMSDCFDDV